MYNMEMHPKIKANSQANENGEKHQSYLIKNRCIGSSIIRVYKN